MSSKKFSISNENFKTEDECPFLSRSTIEETKVETQDNQDLAIAFLDKMIREMDVMYAIKDKFSINSMPFKSESLDEFESDKLDDINGNHTEIECSIKTKLEHLESDETLSCLSVNVPVLPSKKLIVKLEDINSNVTPNKTKNHPLITKLPIEKSKELFVRLVKINNIQKLIYRKTNKETYDNQKKHKCPECSYSAKKKDKVTRHMLVHKKDEEITFFKCSTCSFKSRYKHSLKEHTSKFHPDSGAPKVYYCDICNFKTIHKSSLKPHQKSHIKAGTRARSSLKIECAICSHKSTTRSDLKKHLKTHMDLKHLNTFSCKKCQYKTYQKHHLKRHLLKHEHQKLNNYRKRRNRYDLYKCANCPFKTRYKHSLKQHVVLHLDSRRPKTCTLTYKCNECAFETKRRASILAHLLKHHYHGIRKQKKKVRKIQNVKTKLTYEGIKRKEPKTEKATKHNKIKNNIPSVPFLKIRTFSNLDPFIQVESHEGTSSADTSEDSKHTMRSALNKRKQGTWISKQFKQLEIMPNDGQVYSCYICQYKTNRNILLLQHMSLHDIGVKLSQKSDKCYLKTGITGSKRKANRSRRSNVIKNIQNQPAETFKCARCSFKCSSKTDFLTHTHKNKKQNSLDKILNIEGKQKHHQVLDNKIHSNLNQTKQNTSDSIQYKDINNTKQEPILQEIKENSFELGVQNIENQEADLKFQQIEENDSNLIQSKEMEFEIEKRNLEEEELSSFEPTQYKNIEKESKEKEIVKCGNCLWCTTSFF